MNKGQGHNPFHISSLIIIVFVSGSQLAIPILLLVSEAAIRARFLP
jgi:hypothetical protein